MLSELVEKRLKNQTAFWASEVNFDRNTPEERRVDYVGFKPWNVNGEPVPASVEKGCFGFYEVKSCMADFTSGNGLTFYATRITWSARRNCATRSYGRRWCRRE